MVTDCMDWRPWEHFLTGHDRAVFEIVGRQAGLPAPRRPALIVVDVTRDMCGPEGGSAMDVLKLAPLACGPRAWAAVPVIAELLKAARAANAPVVHTRPNTARLAEIARDEGLAPEAAMAGSAFVPQLEPKFNETVLGKTRPSAFWGTGLADHLDALGADGVVIVGGTTSGCVRATAVDAYSQDRAVVIVPEAVFDRFEVSHAISLFDLHVRYGELMSAEAAAALFNGWTVGVR